MATVNIGNLTFTHRGDYAGGTAYAKNDVVYYATNGNAYIAKQATTGNAPTNGTYWSQFAAGSGGIWNAGLSLGSAGQILHVNSGGNALEFTAAPVGAILQMKSVQFGDTFSTTTSTFTGTSATEYTPATLTITPTSATSLIIVDYTFQCNHDGDYMGMYFLTYNHSGISETSVEHDDQYGSTRQFDRSSNTASDGGYGISGRVILDPQTTNAVTIKHRWATTNSGHATYINTCQSPTSNDPYKGIGSVILTEVAGSIITHTKGNNINGD